MIWLAVALGGALGSVARHGVSVALTHAGVRTTPYATSLVNVTGCLAIGLLAGSIAHGRIQMSAEARVFIFVGLLGGFTTFSSFGLDTLTLLQGGQRALALSNVAAQVGLGLAAVVAGYWVGTR